MLLLALLPAPALARPDDDLVLVADEPLGVYINGQYASLAVSTGAVDHITLNDPDVQRLGLVATRRDRLANLVIGGVVARAGRHGPGIVQAADRLQRQEMFWFPGESLLPEAGSIGPFALPQQNVTVAWQQGTATPYAWPLVGAVDHSAYGVTAVGKRMFLLGADVRNRRPLPLATASTGADLAEILGGRLVGEPWQEEILLGVKRPVRRLQLDKPLEIGPLKFDAVAVRVGGTREASMRLAPGQRPLQAEEDDPAEMLVRGRTAVNRGVARMLLLSRNHLEAQGCISLTVAKATRQFILSCGTPPADYAAPDSGPVPLLPPPPPPAPMPATIPPSANGWLNLAADAPVPARIGGSRVSLTLSSGSLAAVLLNESVAKRIGRDLTAVAGRLLYFGTDVGAFTGAMTGVRFGDRSSAQMVGWVPGEGALDADGSIDLLALPYPRVRVWLQPLPGPGIPLALPMQRDGLWAAATGKVQLPGMRSFSLSAEVSEHARLPLVTAALAAELAKRLGGQLQGPAWSEHLAFGLTRRVRRLVLARPLLIGPLRFDALAVEVSPRRSRATRLERGQIPLPDADADPDEIVVRGRSATGGDTSRTLYLSRTQLGAQRCITLAFDKPGRLWELTCEGPI